MNNPFSLTERHLLITGASSGIGKATAKLCSALGAKLIILGRNIERLNETLKELEGSSHKAITCDLNDQSDINNLIAGIGKLDGVVFCAGTQDTCVTKFLTRESLNKVFETNFFSTINLCTELQKNKKINKGASIVFVSSLTASKLAQIGNAAYSASKGAISAYAKVLALELAPRNIRVNTVIPAMVKTPFLEKCNITPEQFAEDEKNYPLGFGMPEDVANAIAFLLSDGAKWITGSELLLDGGLTLK